MWLMADDVQVCQEGCKFLINLSKLKTEHVLLQMYENINELFTR